MIAIQGLNATYVLDNPPDFRGIDEAALLQQKYLEGRFTEIPDFLDTPIPDWDGLLNRFLSGDLYPLFRAITFAAFSNPAIFLARQDIYGALSNPAIDDRIGALRAGLDMLQVSGYQIVEADRALWNNAIADLNFPDSLRL